jgi:hypothetical protein
MKEALKYLENAKEILQSAPTEDSIYTDIKIVREAFAIAYLSVLEAINQALINRGITKRELPKSVDAYRKAFRKYFDIHDGKLLREFEMLYDALHIAGYYRGLIYNVHAVKDYIKAARAFIEKIG